MFVEKKYIDFFKITAEFLTIYNITDNDIFYDLDGDFECFPSSLSNILSALVALKYCNLDDVFLIGDEQIVLDEFMDPVTAKLVVGDEWTLRELLYFMLMVPASDAAYAVAYNVMNSIPEYDDLSMNKKLIKYAELMNKYAWKLKCENTKLVTLNGSEFVNKKVVTNVTSTCDLIKIITEASKFPELVEILKTKEITFEKNGKKYNLINSNRSIHEDDEFYCRHIIGGITGKSNFAGHCLLCLGESDGKLFAMAMVNAHTDESRYKDTKTIFEGLFGE